MQRHLLEFIPSFMRGATHEQSAKIKNHTPNLMRTINILTSEKPVPHNRATAKHAAELTLWHAEQFATGPAFLCYSFFFRQKESKYRAGKCQIKNLVKTGNQRTQIDIQTAQKGNQKSPNRKKSGKNILAEESQ